MNGGGAQCDIQSINQSVFLFQEEAHNTEGDTERVYSNGWPRDCAQSIRV